MMTRKLRLAQPLAALLLLLALVTAACDDDDDVEVDLGSYSRTAVVA